MSGQRAKLCVIADEELRQRCGQQLRKRRMIFYKYGVIADQQDRLIIDIDLILAEHPFIVDAPDPIKLRTDKLKIRLCRCHRALPPIFLMQ